MPIVTSLQSLTQADPDATDRILILTDSNTELHRAYCRFQAPYDQKIDHAALSALFEDSWQTLLRTQTEQMDPATFPILNALGPYRVTIVTRSVANQILVRDGEAKPMSSYIGME
jgi:hypothetical protein